MVNNAPQLEMTRLEFAKQHGLNECWKLFKEIPEGYEQDLRLWINEYISAKPDSKFCKVILQKIRNCKIKFFDLGPILKKNESLKESSPELWEVLLEKIWLTAETLEELMNLFRRDDTTLQRQEDVLRRIMKVKKSTQDLGNVYRLIKDRDFPVVCREVLEKIKSSTEPVGFWMHLNELFPDDSNIEPIATKKIIEQVR